MKKFVVPEEITLGKFTDNTYAQASFCFRALLKGREIRVNGNKVSSDVLLKKGDEVSYYLSPARQNKKAFEVIFEDENVLVVDKESGVNSEAVFSSLSEKGDTYFIHRLDRNTEGLLIFAKNKRAEKELLAAFACAQVEKIYYAVVVGTPLKQHEVLEGYLKKDEKQSLVTVSEKPCGEKIITEYEIIESRGALSLLKVTLHTGKTHQIRAHLAHVGLPVLGDGKYGNSAVNKQYNATRQRLLSKSLKVTRAGYLGYLSEILFVSEKNL